MGLLSLFKGNAPAQEWVDLIFAPGTPAKKVDKKTIVILTQRKVEECNRIIADCQRIMQTTRNFDTFFSRFDLFDEKIDYMVQLEPYCKFSGQAPSELKAKVNNLREPSINEFLSKSFNEMKNSLEELSTKGGRLRKANKYREALSRYQNQMPTDLFSYYDHKCDKLIKSLKSEENKKEVLL